MRKYDTMENKNDMKARLSTLALSRDTKERNSDNGVCDKECGHAIKTIRSFFDHCGSIF